VQAGADLHLRRDVGGGLPAADVEFVDRGQIGRRQPIG
jgi:hypothetical protein